MVTSENQTKPDVNWLLNAVALLVFFLSYFLKLGFNLFSKSELTWELTAQKHVIASVQLTMQITFGSVFDISVSFHFTGTY